MYLGLDSSTDAEPQLLNQVGRVGFASGVFFQVFSDQRAFQREILFRWTKKMMRKYSQIRLGSLDGKVGQKEWLKKFIFIPVLKST